MACIGGTRSVSLAPIDGFIFVISVIENTDGDSLQDWSEYRFVGGMSENGNSDYDGDGWGNSAEYQRGTDPDDPLSKPSAATLPFLPLLLHDEE